jgi:hypothetical protein
VSITFWKEGGSFVRRIYRLFCASLGSGSCCCCGRSRHRPHFIIPRGLWWCLITTCMPRSRRYLGITYHGNRNPNLVAYISKNYIINPISLTSRVRTDFLPTQQSDLFILRKFLQNKRPPNPSSRFPKGASAI